MREEKRSRARKAAWESFIRKERRELELRKKGQLAGLPGEALAGESSAALRRLAREDQRQAEEGWDDRPTGLLLESARTHNAVKAKTVLTSGVRGLYPVHHVHK